MPSAIIIAGPNGAGKTTFADEYLSAEDRNFEFVNADEIARGFEGRGVPLRSDILAARQMLTRVDELVHGGMNFAVETTLATRTSAQKIPKWPERGYVVSIAYLRLASPEESLARVQRRVAAGGHGIPETTIRRRFGKSLAYFETIFKPIVDEWYVWESREGSCATAVRESIMAGRSKSRGKSGARPPFIVIKTGLSATAVKCRSAPSSGRLQAAD